MVTSSPALIGGASSSTAEAGVGLLIDIGGESSVPSSQPPSTVRPPLYGVQVCPCVLRSVVCVCVIVYNLMGVVYTSTNHNFVS